MTRMLSITIALALFICRVAISVEPTCSIAEFVKSADTLRVWESIPAAELPKHRDSFDRLGKEFQKFSTQDAKSIVMSLRDSALAKQGATEPDASFGNIYVLLRYYFDVPEFEDSADAKVSGGWVGIPSDGKKINTLWPLARDADSGVYLKHHCLAYKGPEYNPLAEFKYLNDKYGRRAKD
ncbi:hypothetical protein [Anatilimnocola floriformis]|uniref:hypothetical protein n=1 Tax=Anatilimnocola floriformis TaxID=2948575 RepID=UPI0020C27DB3|nr:hypothetical protein [Anatilimnocola floriformis]